MEDINSIVNQIASKQAFLKLKEVSYKIFEDNNFLSDSELLAFTIDILRNASKTDYTALLTIWFKEWKASKEVK